MSIPRQVQEAQERAEQLLQQQSQQQPPKDTPPDDTAPPPSTDQLPSDPPATAEQDRQQREDWKAKYHVLQGKYNAEIPRYAAESRTLRDRLEVVEQANATLQGQVAELTAKAAAVPPAPDPGLDKLRSEYGDDVVGTIERLTEQKVAERLKPLQEKVEESEAERQKRQADESRAQQGAAFADAIADLVPDWETIDKLPEFHAFLAEPGADGRSRQESLMDAANRYDAAGAARIFAQFKRTEAFTATQSGVKPPANTDTLARQVTPEPTGRDRTPGDTRAKLWSRVEVRQVFQDIALGKYRSDPEKAKALEQEIETAMREGRVGK